MNTKYFKATLIEVLMVISIIAVFMGMFFGYIGADTNQKALTKDRMNKIEIALTKYFQTNGAYPPTSNNQLLLSDIQIFLDEGAAELARWKDNSGHVIDLFGHGEQGVPFFYRSHIDTYGGAPFILNVKMDSFQLISCGPDNNHHTIEDNLYND